ncbi:MAG TPA: acyl-CoA dehydrogenase [Steroidobacteraceae bacterium]|nr:acyl-CoA dehydrogenase [Steroidobacteraceae bacterium]
MPEYRAPLDDIRFVLNELAGLPELVAAIPAYENATADVVDAVLSEAGRFAGEVLSPLNRPGDREGVRIVGDDVKAAKGFGDAYRAFASSGWVGLSGDPQYGGQGLPHVVGGAASEMWGAANASFSNCPELAAGAITALEAHATPELRARFLPQLLSGEWSATMCLTEPQAGTDLAAVQTRAERDGDRYRLFGRKIFITWGDHDMTDNIVHLVLARGPDAPPGVKGISLFVVPKYRVKADGTLGERNDIRPVSVEHKLGLHASPTCVMALGDHGGAEGFLIGRMHEGIACMFTMMNHMRVSVGLQGVGLADRAYQQAVAYARERRQGSSRDGKERLPIIRYPDVRRMLLTMRALTEAARAIAYVAATHIDLAHHAADEGERRRHQARADLLTPVVKGWSTEVAQEVAALGVQVHGGMGFIEETGAAQILRDARITTIYEGTNGIQAMDLLGRKMLRDGGRAFGEVMREMEALDDGLAAAGAPLTTIRAAFQAGMRALRDSSRFILEESARDENLPGSAAFNFMMLFGIVCGGWQMVRAALVASTGASRAADARFLAAKLATVRFYADQILPRAQTYALAVTAGSASVMAFDEEDF